MGFRKGGAARIAARPTGRTRTPTSDNRIGHHDDSTLRLCGSRGDPAIGRETKMDATAILADVKPALDEYLNDQSSGFKRMRLEQALWENKVGIVRLVEAACSEPMPELGDSRPPR